MKFLFFLLVFSFDAIFIFGLPLYLFFFPFLNNSFTSLFKAYSTDTSIREIVNIVVIYSSSLLMIDLFHGNLTDSFLQVFLLNLMVLFIGVELYVFSKNDRKGKGIYMLLIIFLMNALVAILQSLEISPFWELPELINLFFGANISEGKYFDISYNEFGRVRGLFLLIHKFAPAILAISILFFWHSFNYKKRKLLFLIIAILTLVSAFLTLTRSIFIGLLLGLLVLFISKYKSNIKNKITLLFFGFVFIFLMQSFLTNSSYSFLNRFQQSNSTNISNNDNYRIEGIEISLSNFLENPFIGAHNNSDADKVSVHSIPFRILGGYGLIGVLAYLVMCYKIRKTIFIKLNHRFKVLFILLFYIFLVDLLTHSSGFMFYDVFQFILLMTIFGYSKNKTYNYA